MTELVLLFIGDRALTLEDLGEAVNMRLDDALQHLVDSGKLGEFPAGTQWWNVFRPGCFRTFSEPEPDEGELLINLWREFKEAEASVRETGALTDKGRSELNERLGRYAMARKLSRS